MPCCVVGRPNATVKNRKAEIRPHRLQENGARVASRAVSVPALFRMAGRRRLPCEPRIMPGV